MITAALFKEPKGRNNPNAHQQTSGQIHYGTFNCISSAIKQKKVMIPATVRMNLKNIMLNERNQTQKVIDCTILLIGKSLKSIETEGKLVVVRGWEA